MKIQPLSALVGAASLGVVLLTVSAFQTPVGKNPAQQLLASLGISIDGPVQIDGIPTPSQMMRVEEGQTFIVPSDKLFVCTGLGLVDSAEDRGHPEIRFNGVAVLDAVLIGRSGSLAVTGAGPSIAPIPPGLVAAAGTAVTVLDPQTPERAVLLGYLADA